MDFGLNLPMPRGCSEQMKTRIFGFHKINIESTMAIVQNKHFRIAFRYPSLRLWTKLGLRGFTKALTKKTLHTRQFNQEKLVTNLEKTLYMGYMKKP